MTNAKCKNVFDDYCEKSIFQDGTAARASCVRTRIRHAHSLAHTLTHTPRRDCMLLSCCCCCQLLFCPLCLPPWTLPLCVAWATILSGNSIAKNKLRRYLFLQIAMAKHMVQPVISIRCFSHFAFLRFLLPAVRRCPRFTVILIAVVVVLVAPLSLSYCKLTACPDRLTSSKSKSCCNCCGSPGRQICIFMYLCSAETEAGVCVFVCMPHAVRNCAIFSYRTNSEIFV